MKRQNIEILKFFKNLALFAAVLFVLDFSVGGVLKHFYFKQKFNKITYAINDTRQDFLIFGSSRACRHYIPSVFENKLHVTCYNCGREGAFLIYHLALVSSILERYTPKHIILDITPNEFSVSEEGKLSPLLPYYKNPAVKHFIEYNSKFERFKLWSNIYPYNSLLGIIIVNNVSFRHSRPTDEPGYAGYQKIMSNHPVQQFTHEEIVNERVKILDNFLMKSHKKNVKVTIVISPVYYSFSPNDPVVAILDSLCHKYSNVNFLNYENNPSFVDNKLFSDEAHLNKRGANIFSEDLANKLVTN